MTRARIVLAGLAVAGFGLTGCVEPPKPTPSTIAPLPEVLLPYNRNADKVPYLRAEADLLLSLKTPAGIPLLWPSNGVLLLGKDPDRPTGPHNFALNGKEAGTQIFRLGTSLEDNEYYYWMNRGEQVGGAYGRLDRAGAPAAAGMTLDPTQLLGALGIVALPESHVGLPATAMRFRYEPDAYAEAYRSTGGRSAGYEHCAYVLTTVERQNVSRKILLQRETYFPWSEDPNETLRPFLVKVLDSRGLVVMQARLGDYKPIDVSSLDTPPDEPPVMPTSIEIAFPPPANDPSPGTWRIEKIRIHLSQMETADLLYSEGCRIRLPSGMSRSQLQNVDRTAVQRGGSR